MDNAERKNLKQALKMDIDSADSYMRFALSKVNSKPDEEEKGNRQWIVESLTMLKKQIADKYETFIKEIDDTIEKIS